MFKKYNSIENTYREAFLNRIQHHGFWNDEYIVQEKVHGANLSFWTTDGLTFHAAKRTAQLEMEERFYNFQSVLATLQPKFENIWTDLKGTYPELTQLTIFGELMGGSYPHPDVQRNSKAVKTQKGIFYSPNNEFFAFDILLNRTDFLSVTAANELFEKEGLLYAKTIFKGPIAKCLEHPNDFNSTIPADLGLPEITPNIVEGVIIRPVQPRFFNNGTRVILKHKNEKWSEKNKSDKPVKPAVIYSEKVLQLHEAVKAYITENRLDNVLSKIGEVTIKDFGKVLGLFNKDILEDFQKDYEEVLATLEKKEQKSINKSLGGVTAKIVRTRLVSL